MHKNEALRLLEDVFTLELSFPASMCESQTSLPPPYAPVTPSLLTVLLWTGLDSAAAQVDASATTCVRYAVNGSGTNYTGGPCFVASVEIVWPKWTRLHSQVKGSIREEPKKRRNGRQDRRLNRHWSFRVSVFSPFFFRRQLGEGSGHLNFLAEFRGEMEHGRVEAHRWSTGWVEYA